MIQPRDAIRTLSSLGVREAVRKPKTPADIVYGVHDTPPLTVTLLSGVQLVGSIATTVVVPITILRAAPVPAEVAVGVIGLSFLGLAFAVLIQALPRGPVGSGYLAPSSFTGLFLGPATAALAAGGLPVVFGMTFFAGLVQTALAPLIRRLRPFLPPEVTGAVTFLLGTSTGLVGVRDLLGLGLAGPVPPEHWGVGGFTLLLIVVLNVWSRGLLRLSCVLIGLVAGYAASIATGLLPAALLTANPEPILAWPRLPHAGLAFEPKLAATFMLVGVVSAIKCTAVITACQRTNDAGYIRPDFASIQRGVLADGIVTIMAGLVGSTGFNASASAPGLAAATGVTSRRVALAMAAVLALLALSPAAISIFAAIPAPVAGAALVFTSCFIVTSGVEIMASRLLDNRRMLVVASAIIAAEGAQSVGQVATMGLPPILQQLAASPLLMGTVVALGLNLAFRPRRRRNDVLMLDPAAFDTASVQRFMDARGAAWGARPQVIERAAFALTELAEAIVRDCRPEGSIRLDADFDEFRIILKASYRGTLVPFPTARPSLDELTDSTDGLLRLSGFLVRSYADAARGTLRDGACSIDLRFDH